MGVYYPAQKSLIALLQNYSHGPQQNSPLYRPHHHPQDRKQHNYHHSHNPGHLCSIQSFQPHLQHLWIQGLLPSVIQVCVNSQSRYPHKHMTAPQQSIHKPVGSHPLQHPVCLWVLYYQAYQCSSKILCVPLHCNHPGQN